MVLGTPIVLEALNLIRKNDFPKHAEVFCSTLLCTELTLSLMGFMSVSHLIDLYLYIFTNGQHNSFSLNINEQNVYEIFNAPIAIRVLNKKK